MSTNQIISFILVPLTMPFITMGISFIVFYFVNKKQKKYITDKLGYEIVNEMKYGTIYHYFVIKYIKDNDKYGFCINKKNIVLPIYDEIKFYKKNVDTIPVMKDGKWGFVRITDNWEHKLGESIPPIYDAVEDFSVIKSLVTLNSEQFYINRKGEIV